jgi:superfamily II DNA or RNA helicase
VLAREVFIEKRGLPSSALRKIQNLAAFQNPEFYKRQNLRLSTHATPRVIECALDFPEHIGIPRGCFEELQGFVKAHHVALEVQDKRVLGQSLPLRFHGTLREEQREAVEAALAHDTGTVVAPPGAGKTVVGAALIAERCQSTLVLVHRTPLLEQWVVRLTTFLGVRPGTQGAGKSALTGEVDVAMLQSAVRGAEVQPWVAQYGYVLVDECHHLPAVSFERVLRAVQARYVTGLTATFQRRDGHQPIVSMQVGPVRHTIAPARISGRQGVHHRLLIRHTDFRAPPEEPSFAIQRLYARLAADERRNDLIFDDVLSALEQGRSPIVLTERTDHLRYLASRFAGFARNIVSLRGGTRTKARRESLARLAAIPADAERLVLATGRYVGEGFDDARFDTLFLVMPIAWKGTLIQYAGRLHRESAGKREVRIYDYVDAHVPVLARMFEKRRQGYRAMGYEEAAGSTLPLEIWG